MIPKPDEEAAGGDLAMISPLESCETSTVYALTPDESPSPQKSFEIETPEDNRPMTLLEQQRQTPEHFIHLGPLSTPLPSDDLLVRVGPMSLLATP